MRILSQGNILSLFCFRIEMFISTTEKLTKLSISISISISFENRNVYTSTEILTKTLQKQYYFFNFLPFHLYRINALLHS